MINLGMMGAKPAPGGSGGWAPASLTGLVLWSRADDFTSAGAVSTWADRANAGSSVPAAPATFEPVVALNVLNGKPGVAFTADYFTGTLPAWSQNEGSLFAVARLASAAAPTEARILGIASTSGNDATQHALHIRRSVLTESVIAGNNSLTSTPQAVTYGTPFSFSVVKTSTGFTTYLNGVAGTPVATTLTMTLNRYVIGARAFTSNTVNSTNSWSDYLFEVGVVKAAMSTTERQKLEGYLHHYWGIAAALDSGHPYKTAPP